MALSNQAEQPSVSQKQLPGIVLAARLILAALATVWLLFSGYAFFFRERINWGDLPIAVWLAVFMLINALALGLAAWVVAFRTRWSYLYVLTLTAVNFLATFADQIGLADLLFALPVFALLVILVWKRKAFVEEKFEHRQS